MRMRNFILMICLVFGVTVSRGQQTKINQIRLNCVNYIKRNLIAPSTFVLVDALGNKVSINTIKVEHLKEETVRDSFCYKVHNCCPSHIVREIYYDGDTTNVIGDKREILDYCVCFKKKYSVKRYHECYYVRFYYEAQNSFGAKIQKSVTMYVPLDGQVCYMLEYDTRKYDIIEEWEKFNHNIYNNDRLKKVNVYKKIPEGFDKQDIIKEIREQYGEEDF